MHLKSSIIAISALLCGTAFSNAEVTLVRNSAPAAKIYHAPLAQEPMPREYNDAKTFLRTFGRTMSDEERLEQLLANAIEDLNYHIEKMSGTKLEIVVTDDPKSIKPPAIVIGPLAEKMKAGPTAFKESAEAFRIKVGDGMVLIAGRGEYSKLGASHGVYELLNQIGCDWLFPGNEGEIIPKRSTVVIADQDIQSAPSFNPRQSWYGGMQQCGESQFYFFRWQQRSKMQQHGLLQLVDAYRVGGHTWGGAVIKPNKEEFDANPDMYGMRKESDGTLVRSGQMETTNPRVIELCLKYIRDQFEKNQWPKDKDVCIPFGPGDGGAISESWASRMAGTERKAIDSGRPDGTDLIVLLLNTLLERTEKEFPNMKLGFLLYSWHADYPMRYKPHPRVAIEIADLNFSRLHGVGCTSSKTRAYYRNVLENWGRLHEEQGNLMYRWYYGYNVANGYLPLSMLKIFGEGIPFDHSIGVSGLRFNLYDNWEVTGPNNYVAAKLAWNHELDWKELLRGYCEKAYGKGADDMERYFLAMTDRQCKAGREAGAFFAYPLIYDYDFLDKMDGILNKAMKNSETDIEKTRISYMMIQPQRLRMYLDLRGKIADFDFAGAQELHKKMLELHAKDMERNINFASRMGATFFRGHLEGFLEQSVKYSNAPYNIVYKVPERLKTAIDREVIGQHMRFFGRDVNDDHYLVSSTYASTWDAQGFDGYRKGAVWYRIPFRLDAGSKRTRKLAEGEGYGLFIGGGEGVINAWCNEHFIGKVRGYVTRPHVLDITDYIEPDGDNLIALQLDRVGNDELGTGGLMMPSFIFTGPRVEMDEKIMQKPFRVLPGGILEYIE